MTIEQREGATARTGRRSRRDEILQIAVGLFASRGYHGVSMDDIGAAAGVTGPALYHHFAGKEAMLVGALKPVSEGLLSGGRAQVQQHPDDPRAALYALVHFHVDFALANPAVIVLHLNELDRLPEEPRRQIRRLQRLYVEVWVDTLTGARADLRPDEARVLAHATFGLMNSTPFLGGEVGRDRRADLLCAAAMSALLPQYRSGEVRPRPADGTRVGEVQQRRPEIQPRSHPGDAPATPRARTGQPTMGGGRRQPDQVA